MVDRIRYPTVSYLPFYYVFFQFLLLTIFNLQANILTTKDILSNLAYIGTIFMALSVNPRPHSIGPFLGKRLSQMAFAVILPVNRAGIPRTGCSAPPIRQIAFNKP